MLYIGGKFQKSSSDKVIKVINPATEQVIAQVPEANEADVSLAVKSARQAFESGPWHGTTGAQRAVFLRAIAAQVAAKKLELAKLETKDCGKPLKESEWDMDDVSGCFEFFAGQAEALDKRQGEKVDLGEANPNFRCELHYQASGVVAAIIPWNYPLLMFAWKVAPALAAGCTIVVKPSELTPLTALEMGKIFDAVKLPPGVVNIITGAGATGAALVRHQGVDKVAFTGSVPTGVRVGTEAMKDVKNVTLELGGKSAIIVFDDVDIIKAVEWVMFGCFWTNGQICSATSRLLIHQKIADKFLAALAKACEGIYIGDPSLPENAEKTGTLGPVVSAGQHRRVMGYIQQAVKEGATVVTGGKRPANLKSGYFVQPTVLKVTPKMTIWKEEVFGPVLSVVSFSTEQEAIKLANDSDFGLAGAVISDDEARCKRVGKALRCGIMWVNCSQPAFVQAPWGGLKKSGVGRELGARGIENYLEPKQITSYVSKDAFGWYKHLPSKL